MAKDNKVKRRRTVKEKKDKQKHSFLYRNQTEDELKIDEIDELKSKEELELRQQSFENLLILKQKYYLAKQKARQLNKEFLLTKRNEYANNQEFLKAYKVVVKKRQVILNELHHELKIKTKEYKARFETFDYKVKRWFFGMGKEFNRVSWLKRKEVLYGFLIVVVISIILALIFLGVDSIFLVRS